VNYQWISDYVFDNGESRDGHWIPCDEENQSKTSGANIKEDVTHRLRLVGCTLRVRGASPAGRGAYPRGTGRVPSAIRVQFVYDQNAIRVRFMCDRDAIRVRCDAIRVRFVCDQNAIRVRFMCDRDAIRVRCDAIRVRFVCDQKDSCATKRPECDSYVIGVRTRPESIVIKHRDKVL
jgi:hypothetical protein